MFLKGPLSMQPPPLPAGLRPLLPWLTFAPCPLMLVSLPSKIGEVSGLDAQRPQSQYCLFRLAGDNSERVALDTYRLSSVISALSPQGLFIRPGIISVPRKEVALQKVLKICGKQASCRALTVPWIVSEFLIWMATKSSYRDFAPGYCAAGS